MKIMKLKMHYGLAAAALLLAGAMSPSQAQTVLTGTIATNFPIGDNTANFTMPGWITWYNTPGGNAPMTCNISTNADGVAGRGCLEVDCPFAGQGGTQNLWMWWLNNNATYAPEYTCNLLLSSNITFKVHVPPGTPVDTDGNFNTIAMSFIHGGWNLQSLGVTLKIPGAASNGWVTMTCPINLSTPNLTTCCGLAFNIQAYGGTYYQQNFTNYIDDISINLSPAPPPPPPTLTTIIPAITGFNMTATDPNGANDRYNILTAVATGYSFVGQTSVTYSWTNKSWPSIGTANSWQQLFFLVSGVSSSGAPNGDPGQYDAAVDWNLANVLWFTVQQATNGTAYINFRCKTNEPNGNGMFFNGLALTDPLNTNGWPVEPLAFFPASTPLGPWSVTIAGTTVTIMTPDGTSTNVTLDAATAALFADPMTLCLGSQPNNANGFGQTAVISGFGVTGNATPFSDDFTSDTTLNTNIWRVLANDPNGVNLVPPGSAFWVSWSLPDDGFSFQSTPSLPQTPIGWNNPTVLTILDNNMRQALVPWSATGTNQGYFRLIKRAFTQLQVLLPGETNAPNTLTGKTGTPTSVSAGSEVDVTVNAVDATYHIVNVSDAVHLTCTDSGAILPNDASMVNGTLTFTTLYLNDSGSWTVTATDTGNTAIPPATSSSITVP
jgi:hypothetical protein